jgi:hypothetical protein
MHFELHAYDDDDDDRGGGTIRRRRPEVRDSQRLCAAHQSSLSHEHPQLRRQRLSQR